MEMNATTDSPPSSPTVATCVEALARAGLMLVAILVILILLVALLFIIYFVTSNRRPKICKSNLKDFICHSLSNVSIFLTFLSRKNSRNREAIRIEREAQAPKTSTIKWTKIREN